MSKGRRPPQPARLDSTPGSSFRPGTVAATNGTDDLPEGFNVAGRWRTFRGRRASGAQGGRSPSAGSRINQLSKQLIKKPALASPTRAHITERADGLGCCTRRDHSAYPALLYPVAPGSRRGLARPSRGPAAATRARWRSSCFIRRGSARRQSLEDTGGELAVWRSPHSNISKGGRSLIADHWVLGRKARAYWSIMPTAA